ncbi:NADPH-dependent FMN reductase [Chondromyces apiculatus]|uniref:Putative reductase n=1 Tax=Chondromyces apiculatus DSM 436 TaxID=1192034 RepID=A0A017THX3_9BACT|nr:NAD(P)H-dependent oxidoreductase [Chondromyces apiculatus]EYF08482.1 putative reductase [Chondromyces apiculatus DSM 436]
METERALDVSTSSAAGDLDPVRVIAGPPPLAVGVILASVREGRRGEALATWIAGLLAERPGVTAEILDLRDWPLQVYARSVGTRVAEAQYEAEELEARWMKKLTGLDAFVIVTPEFNHSYPGNLKNALDIVSTPWNHKPVTFVSYGYSSAGARAVEQLRLVTIELRMIPIRDELNLPIGAYEADAQGAPVNRAIVQHAGQVIDELSWLGRLLKQGRAERRLAA